MDTVDDVILPANTWVNLYTTSGITVGTAVMLQNKGSSSCYICIASTTPLTPRKGIILSAVDQAGNGINIYGGQSGLWAWAEQDTRVLVQA